MAQDELPQPVTGTHAVKPRVLAAAHEISQRLKLLRRHRDRGQQPARVQRGQPPRVALVGLDPIAGPRRNQARRDDLAVNTARDNVTMQPKPVGPASCQTRAAGHCPSSRSTAA
jgi:hypothetical protein